MAGLLPKGHKQPCPEQFDVAEVLEPDQQAVIGDVELLHLCPLAFVHGHGAVVYALWVLSMANSQPRWCFFTRFRLSAPLYQLSPVIYAPEGTKAGSSPQARTSSSMSRK